MGKFNSAARLALAAACGVAGLAIASPARAQVTGVTSIQVLDNGQQNFSFAELLAYSSTDLSGTNLATSGTASATSSGFGTTPQDANDGNTNGNYSGNADLNSIWHDNSTAADTWTLTFASPQTIGSLQVFGRTDCCQERDNNVTVNVLHSGGTFSQTFALLPDTGQGVQTIVVPEPASLGVLALGGLALLARRRR